MEGSESYAPTATEGLEDESPGYGDKKAKKGGLLKAFKPGSDEEHRIAKHHLSLWEQQDKLLERAKAQWGVNAARRAGIGNAKVIKRRGRDGVDEHWTAWMPKNASPDLTPDINKAATLCRRLTSQMYIDPFIAEVESPDGDDEHKAAAELSQRVLYSLQDEQGLNETKKQRRSYDRSHVYGSGYIEYFIDQQGGGSEPVTVKARPDAIHADVALVDPITGQEGPATDSRGNPLPYQDRMVDESGNFVEDANDAAVQYKPKLCSQVLDSRHVRLLPSTCADIWEAEAVLIAAMPTWGEVKKMAPDIAKVDDEVIGEIMSYRPSFADALTDVDLAALRVRVGGKWNDARPVFVLKSYHKRCPEYPDGLMLITIGGKYVLHRSEWIDDSDGRKRPLSLPLTQHCGFDEGREGYWKVGLMEIVGPGQEIRSAQISAWLDHVEHFGRRKTYLPTNSIINPDQIRNPTATVLPINPGGEPIHEDIPEFPGDMYQLYQEMGLGMEDATGLNTGPGPKTQSGRHEFAVLSEQHAGMAEHLENVEAAFLRGSRITLELARAFFDTEQTSKFAGKGARRRMMAWRGSDLVVEPDLKIKAGSGTMLAPAAKVQLAERMAGLQVIDHDDLKEVVTSNVGVQIGIQDNPHRLRILGQIAEWREGPPPGWQPQPPQIGPTGQQIPAPDPVLSKMWMPIKADELPPVASMRLKELADAMAGPKYQMFPPEWRMALDNEYMRMGMVLQAAQQTPPNQNEPGGPSGNGKSEQPRDVPGLDKGKPANDLQEDALQEGAPPNLVGA